MLIELLVTVALGLHLMCVNVASAGPMICLWLEWRDGRGDPLARETGVVLSSASLVTLVLGVAFGLAVGLLLWDDAYATVLQRFPSRIGYGLVELGFSAVLVACHAIWWKYQQRTGALLRGIRYLLLFAAGTNLLYHFPFLFVLIANVANSGDTARDVLDGEFVNMISAGPVLARVTHFILAAFAVSGVLLIGFALRLRRSGREDDAQRVAIWGGRIALAPTLLQLLVGLWVTFTLSPIAIRRLMGGDLLATALLISSLLAALWLMHKLASISFGDASQKNLIGAICLMVAVVLLMTGVLRASQQRAPGLHPRAAARLAQPPSAASRPPQTSLNSA